LVVDESDLPVIAAVMVEAGNATRIEVEVAVVI
jgi:hypothetical protein